ncbi:MAG: 5,6-dimethylbenzimidazole synthase [Gammaproteobacteria bacterium]|nr:5,6-dimethylbenzimidazole synthase [Gammaproteobacteria bacterium]
MTDNRFQYTQADRDAIYRVINERRDMRHFCGGHVKKDTLWKLLEAAHHGPSVGYMQPWRFIHITDINKRQAIHGLVEQERLLTRDALGDRGNEFMKLKLEGILECAELLVVALADKREQHIVGRRTLPEMDLASAACAIENMWLAARAEGLGMGWVSLFSPDDLKQLLRMPDGSHPVAILCLGPVEQFYERPMLEIAGWVNRENLQELVFENNWEQSALINE